MTKTLQLQIVTQADRWDACAQAAQAGFMQSWAWADFRQRQGYHSWRYGLFDQADLVGGAAVYHYPHAGAAHLLISPGGPFFLPGYASAGMPLLLEQVRSQSPTAIGWRIEPTLATKPDWLPGFVRAPADLLPSETLLVDLRPSESAILQAMPPKGRYNIRLAARSGVETNFSTDPQAISSFYDRLWDTAQRQEFFAESYGFFINLCQTLFAAGQAEIGLATWRGEVLAALLVVYWGDRATYLYGGSAAAHRQVMAPYALHWAAMQRAKSRGHRVYDFYGYTQDPQHSYAKFSQFKRKFGGERTITIGAQDYFFYDQLADTLVQVFKQLRPQPARDFALNLSATTFQPTDSFQPTQRESV